MQHKRLRALQALVQNIDDEVGEHGILSESRTESLIRCILGWRHRESTIHAPVLHDLDGVNTTLPAGKDGLIIEVKVPKRKRPATRK